MPNKLTPPRLGHDFHDDPWDEHPHPPHQMGDHRPPPPPHLHHHPHAPHHHHEGHFGHYYPPLPDRQDEQLLWSLLQDADQAKAVFRVLSACPPEIGAIGGLVLRLHQQQELLLRQLQQMRETLDWLAQRQGAPAVADLPNPQE